ncbi:MAG: hypothetical protein ACE5HX_18950 [bacterium]
MPQRTFAYYVLLRFDNSRLLIIKEPDVISNPDDFYRDEKSGVGACSDFSPEILRGRNDKVSLSF